MGVVDGAAGDACRAVMNVESAAEVPFESRSAKDLVTFQLHSPAEQQKQVAANHLGGKPVMITGKQRLAGGDGPILRPHHDQMAAAAFQEKVRVDQKPSVEKDGVQGPLMSDVQQSNGSVSNGSNGDVDEKGFKRDIRDLEELLSKLNPMAEEFVPPVLTNNHRSGGLGGFGGVYPKDNGFPQPTSNGNGNASGYANGGRRKKSNYSQGKRMNNRTSMAQREEIIRRTVYVSDIDQQITEEHLAALFINCGQVVDCRICGDPNSVLRFAFIEFMDEEGARAALGLAGTMLGYYPVRVVPSKTAIAPVNPTFLPRSEDEREMCTRTIYCTNIDKRISQADVKLFFESVCGEVYRLRLLGDYNHSTRIAFVEFMSAQSAIAALNCSGVVLGSLPIRISPSKTPVRPRAPRPSMH